MSYIIGRSFQDLKKIAENLDITYVETPLCALKLIDYLEVPHGNEDDAKKDFKGQINPLYEVPAFLKINKITGERKIYYNSYARFWNFYLMHEVAHYLLGHTTETYLSEIEADMLACILIAPPEIVINKAENSYEVCKLCNIPIDKADMYWQEIFDERERRK